MRLLWTPDPQQVARSKMAAFRSWLRTERGLDLPDGYQHLWQWSVDEPSQFWGALADFFHVRFHDRPAGVLGDASMPGAQWFPGATLNYAEHALASGPGKQDG